MYSHFSQHFNKNARTRERGFGLIELMVSISIMMLVAGVILIRQDSFNGAVLLRSQAYEIALAIREVQLNAVSATTIQGSTRDLLGIQFDTDAARNNTYRMFRDSNDNGYASTEEFGQQGGIDSRFYISAIEVNGGSLTGTGLSVEFERPNFDAKFYNNGAHRANISEVSIVIAEKKNPTNTRKVVITSAGQITVE